MANVFGHNYEIYIVRPYEVHKSATVVILVTI